MDALARLLKGGSGNVLFGTIKQVYDNDIYDIDIKGFVIRSVPAQIPPGVTRVPVVDATSSEAPKYKSLYSIGQEVSIFKTTKSLSGLIITGSFAGTKGSDFTTFSY
jgi:hypothetical protein